MDSCWKQSELSATVQEAGTSKALRKWSTACGVSGPSKHDAFPRQISPLPSRPLPSPRTLPRLQVCPCWSLRKLVFQDEVPTTRCYVLSVSEDRTRAERTDLPSWFCALEGNWIQHWFYCSFHRLKIKMFIKQKPHTIWYRRVLEFCFCTAETRADVVMVEMEPVLLPRSTSP